MPALLWLRPRRGAISLALFAGAILLIAGNASAQLGGLERSALGLALISTSPDPAPVQLREPAVRLSDLLEPALPENAVPLPVALRQLQLTAGPRAANGGFPAAEKVRPGVVLVKFKRHTFVDLLCVEAGSETAAMKLLRTRPDVEFCELDRCATRAFAPSDPLLAQQWHHPPLGSFQAWDIQPGGQPVRVGIVDTAFQMDHPDLAANTDPGWDVVTELPVVEADGIPHSTLAAGLIAGVIDNGLGVAGLSQSRLVPLQINGPISEMYNAVIWAADQGIRVVNISWTEGGSDTLNAAGAYLREHARGMLMMAGGNLGVPAYTTNQPDIYCISMTDSADRMQSLSGVHIDFAAPGWAVYSTTTGSGYAYGTGTSYSAPIFAGIVAALMGINPLLSPEELVQLLKQTAVDKGSPGWDEWYGWGRIDFSAAAAAVFDRLPRLEVLSVGPPEVWLRSRYIPGTVYTLWRASVPNPERWTEVPNALVSTDGDRTLFRDAEATDAPRFYLLEAWPK